MNSLFPDERAGATLHHTLDHVDRRVVRKYPFSKQVHRPKNAALKLSERGMHSSIAVFELQWMTSVTEE